MTVTGWEFTPDSAEFTGLTSPQKAQVTRLVVAILFSLTGRQFGYETLTVRPVIPPPARPTNDRSRWPSPWPGYTLADVLGGPGCGRVRSLRLAGPVAALAEVRCDGAVLDPSAYELLDQNLLVRLDGATWPTGQDLTLAVDQAATMQVTYTRGRPLPPAGQDAASSYATQVAKALTGGSDCQLPDRVRSITREGVDVAFIDPEQFIDSGKTGVHDVDLWIKAVNPTGLLASDAWSPDLPALHRVTPVPTVLT